MTQQQIDTLTAMLASHAAACREKEKALLRDERRDEAVFARIEGNVYDIYRTVCTAGVRTAADPDQAWSLLCRKTEEITAAWEANLERVRTHGDAEKVHIETLKLQTAAAIRVEMDRLGRDEA